MWAVPANTPKDIQKILEKALLQAIAEPEVKEIIIKWNRPYDLLNSEATTEAVFNDHQKAAELFKVSGPTDTWLR